ncbi:hypothetical protein TNCV_3885071 [Trichonephila clavipes]|nr:hypothetical protein TNCV_3885071 [Trichonephila clavipes]
MALFYTLLYRVLPNSTSEFRRMREDSMGKKNQLRTWSRKLRLVSENPDNVDIGWTSTSPGKRPNKGGYMRVLP